MKGHFRLIEKDYYSIKQILNQGDVSCSEVVQSYLQQIDDKAHLNAFLTILNERALIQAESVDKKIANGTAGPLAGMVVAVKDILAMKDTVTTCGSRILENFIAPYTATAIERLENADAIVIGKTNMDEFGMGSTNENSAYSPVKNPADENRVPGGSSGGSAAAVAANLAMTAVGTDTGGSVRQPASWTGVIGLRPTYGRISRYGLVAFASSLDTVGLLAKSVEDCAAMLEVMAGSDEMDMTCSNHTVDSYLTSDPGQLKGLRIGLPKEYFGDGLDSEIDSCIHNTISSLKEQGAEIVDISLPHTGYGVATYYLICTAEASSNLARYDGVRFGLRTSSHDLNAMYVESRSAGFGKEVKRRIMLGSYVLSAGYYDAYYRKAQKVRTLIREDFEKAFQQCDVIAGPTAPTVAPLLGEMTDDPMKMYLSDVYTVLAPMAGVPAISIPIGVNSQSLPIGLQLTGPHFSERLLLNTSRSVLDLTR